MWKTRDSPKPGNLLLVPWHLSKYYPRKVLMSTFKYFLWFDLYLPQICTDNYNAICREGFEEKSRRNLPYEKKNQSIYLFVFHMEIQLEAAFYKPGKEPSPKPFMLAC
jgi:hypothetical protein